MNKASTAPRRKTVSERVRMSARLSKMLKRQIDALEAEVEDGFSENRVKSLLLVAKTLQAMEVAAPKPGKVVDADTSDAVDILEFRDLLEKRISALVDGGEAGLVPLAVEPAGVAAG